MRLFTYRLAKELHMIHGEMMERMTAYELREWWAFYQLEQQAIEAANRPQARQQTPEEILRALGG